MTAKKNPDRDIVRDAVATLLLFAINFVVFRFGLTAILNAPSDFVSIVGSILLAVFMLGADLEFARRMVQRYGSK
jgi:hypothetical protein